LGVMVPGDFAAPVEVVPQQARPHRTAFLLRDGRCEADGRVSFGFLVPMKAWVFESAARTLRNPLIVIAGSGIVISDSDHRDHSVGAKRR
jgi:hypothetical protein